jgi:hypothetical protein
MMDRIQPVYTDLAYPRTWVSRDNDPAVLAVLVDPAHIPAINLLVDSNGCTRYTAAKAIYAGLKEGYTP